MKIIPTPTLTTEIQIQQNNFSQALLNNYLIGDAIDSNLFGKVFLSSEKIAQSGIHSLILNPSTNGFI